MKYLIFGNFGDNTIALIQWAHLQRLESVVVAHVETGLGASQWQERVAQGQQLARQFQFATVTLTPTLDFTQLIKDRKDFPSVKYQWCTTFLKALPLLNFLDEHDPSNNTMILLGSRKADSRARSNLPTFIEESEYYGDRSVSYPLCDFTNEQRDRLIKLAGFEVLNSRSLECNPCVHFEYNHFAHLPLETVEKIAALEQEISKCMFKQKPLSEIVISADKISSRTKTGIESFDLGCGSRYVCGE